MSESELTIHLKLPNVSNENSEGDLELPLDGNGKLIENSGNSFLPLEMTRVESQQEEVSRQPFKKDLSDLYAFLQQLSPGSITSTASDYNDERRRVKKKTGLKRGGESPVTMQNGQTSSDAIDLSDSMSERYSLEANFEFDTDQKTQVKRELLKMSSINLYQLILPSTQFLQRGGHH